MPQAQAGSTQQTPSEAQGRGTELEALNTPPSPSSQANAGVETGPEKFLSSPGELLKVKKSLASDKADDKADEENLSKRKRKAIGDENENGFDEILASEAVGEGQAKMQIEIPGDNPKAKKRKKMKIKIGDASGTRVVFDENGQAQNPLQALANEDTE